MTAEIIRVADPDPLQAGPMHEDDVRRWEQFTASNINVAEGYGEVYRAWTDPNVTSPTIRSRLVALLTSPMDIPNRMAMGVSAAFGGSLPHIFIHKIDGDATPRDLPALLEDRPDLARELLLGVRYWRNYPGIMNDFDRRKFNFMSRAVAPYIGRLAAAHELDDMPMVDHLVGKPAVDDFVDVSAPKILTPWTHSSEYRAKHDPYNELALELQSGETTPKRATETVNEWFRIVQKQEKSNPLAYDAEHGVDRIEGHAVALAEDPQGDKNRLALIVSKLLDHREKRGNDNGRPSESGWMSGLVVLEIPDIAIRARLMQTKVLHRTTDHSKREQNDKVEIYTYKIKSETDRRAADWYLDYVQVRRKRTGETVIAQEILRTAIAGYDTEQAERARKEAARRTELLAGRMALYGEVQPRLF